MGVLLYQWVTPLVRFLVRRPLRWGREFWLTCNIIRTTSVLMSAEFLITLLHNLRMSHEIKGQMWSTDECLGTFLGSFVFIQMIESTHNVKNSENVFFTLYHLTVRYRTPGSASVPQWRIQSCPQTELTSRTLSVMLPSSDPVQQQRGWVLEPGAGAPSPGNTYCITGGAWRTKETCWNDDRKNPNGIFKGVLKTWRFLGEFPHLV